MWEVTVGIVVVVFGMLGIVVWKSSSSGKAKVREEIREDIDKSKEQMDEVYEESRGTLSSRIAKRVRERL